MAKLVNLIPGREIKEPVVKEDLEDLDVALPSQLERFLDRAINVIKKYNLTRSKEAYVVAKILDALNINPSQLSSIISKIKRAGVVHREGIEEKTKTPAERIRDTNNRVSKLRDKITATKSQKQKDVLQKRVKNALQSLSNMKKLQGIKKIDR